MDNRQLPIGKKPPRLTGRDLPILRRELQFEVEDLAKAIGFDPDEVESWERSPDPIPRLASRRARWVKADWQRSSALAESGLPICEWVQAWHKRNAGLTELDKITASYEALHEHGEDCPICQKRVDYVNQRFPPMDPYPTGGWTGLWFRLAGWYDDLPSWLQPAAAGAALLAMMTLPGAAIGALVEGLDDPSMFLIGPVAVLLASGAGAVGGLVYSFLGRPLRRLGAIGDYAAGIVAVFGYMGAIVIVAQLLFHEPFVEGTDGAIIFLAVSTFFGLVVGYQFRRLDA